MATIHVSQSWSKDEYAKCLSEEQTALLTQEPSGVINLEALVKQIGNATGLRAACASGACACLSSACCGEDQIQIDTIPTGVIDLHRLVKLIGGRDGVLSACASGAAGTCDCFSRSCCDGALLG